MLQLFYTGTSTHDLQNSFLCKFKNIFQLGSICRVHNIDNIWENCLTQTRIRKCFSWMKCIAGLFPNWAISKWMRHFHQTCQPVIHFIHKFTQFPFPQLHVIYLSLLVINTIKTSVNLNSITIYEVNTSMIKKGLIKKTVTLIRKNDC